MPAGQGPRPPVHPPTVVVVPEKIFTSEGVWHFYSYGQEGLAAGYGAGGARNPTGIEV